MLIARERVLGGYVGGGNFSWSLWRGQGGEGVGVGREKDPERGKHWQDMTFTQKEVTRIRNLSSTSRCMMLHVTVANSDCRYAEDFYVERSWLISIFRGGE